METTRHGFHKATGYSAYIHGRISGLRARQLGPRVRMDLSRCGREGIHRSRVACSRMPSIASRGTSQDSATTRAANLIPLPQRWKNAHRVASHGRLTNVSTSRTDRQSAQTHRPYDRSDATRSCAAIWDADGPIDGQSDDVERRSAGCVARPRIRRAALQPSATARNDGIYIIGFFPAWSRAVTGPAPRYFPDYPFPAVGILRPVSHTYHG